jgi:cystathionine gamma-lyase
MHSDKFNTKVIHAGVHLDPATGAIMTPIYQTSTFAQESPGVNKGYAYARAHNPTRTQLQNSIAALENAKYGLCFSSGMAAIDAVCKLLKPEDEVLVTMDLYGGSYRLFTEVYAPLGIHFHFVDMNDLDTVKSKINKKTRMIWAETPTNPLMSILDIKALSNIAKEHHLLMCVDNTFASPYLQNPMNLGADIVMHSATKYINGHSDVVMGMLVCDDEEVHKNLASIQNSCGAIPGPMDCFLVLRGVKTLHVRMKRHCENGREVAHFLSKHPRVEKVYWPGFDFHPGHDIARRQMLDFGGMMSFYLKGDKLEDAVQFVTHTEIFTLAESLGGVESLCCHPATMSHGSIPREERLKIGLSDSLIRLSVGIEDISDLIEDLDKALSA